MSKGSVSCIICSATPFPPLINPLAVQNILHTCAQCSFIILSSILYISPLYQLWVMSIVQCPREMALAVYCQPGRRLGKGWRGETRQWFDKDIFSPYFFI
jgi:hypothetical protein